MTKVTQHVTQNIGLPGLITEAETFTLSETRITLEVMPNLIYACAHYLSINGSEDHKQWIEDFVSSGMIKYKPRIKFEAYGGVRDLTNIHGFSDGGDDWIDFTEMKSFDELVSNIDHILKLGARYGIDWDYGDCGLEEGNALIQITGYPEQCFDGKEMLKNLHIAYQKFQSENGR